MALHMRCSYVQAITMALREKLLLISGNLLMRFGTAFHKPRRLLTLLQLKKILVPDRTIVVKRTQNLLLATSYCITRLPRGRGGSTSRTSSEQFRIASGRSRIMRSLRRVRNCMHLKLVFDLSLFVRACLLHNVRATLLRAQRWLFLFSWRPFRQSLLAP